MSWSRLSTITTLQHIQSEPVRGRRIKLIQEFYGQHYAEIQGRWGLSGETGKTWAQRFVRFSLRIRSVARRVIVVKIYHQSMDGDCLAKTQLMIGQTCDAVGAFSAWPEYLVTRAGHPVTLYRRRVGAGRPMICMVSEAS